MLFEAHVDRNVEWGGLMTDNVIDEAGTHDAQVEEGWEDESALDELRSIDSSTKGEDNEKKKEKYPQFNMHTDMVKPQFKVEMLFGTSQIFKDVFKQHVIKTGKQSILSKMTALGQVNSTWLSKQYMETLKTNPTWPLSAFQKAVQMDYDVGVSKSQVYRAKRKAQDLIEGNHEEQYAKLWDYCEEIRRSNPGSTIIMQVHEIQLEDENEDEDEDEDDVGKSRFERIYKGKQNPHGSGFWRYYKKI
ncbi:hypothetical protein ACSBR1_017459 [Camellia fascicularis]